MEITRINSGSWGLVRAFFDITTQEGFTLKGFKIIEGANGLFVSYPSQKDNDGEYQDTIWSDKEIREKVLKMALEKYHSSAADVPQSDEIPF